MKRKSVKFIIVSPRQRCGGPIVLHLLCKLLTERGYNAKIFYPPYFDENLPFARKFISTIKFYLYDYLKYKSLITRFIFPKKAKNCRYEHIKGCKRKFLKIYDKKNTIVVYPEIILGNPLHAKNVVRWMLFYDKYKEGDYNDDDFFIAYREVFNNEKLNPDCNIVHLTNFNSSLYRRYNYGERHGTCYIVRKGKNRSDLPESFDGPVIDSFLEEDKVKVFNESEKCIDYDCQTFYATIAAICGCDVIVKMEPGKTKSDYRKSGDGPCWGVAYGESEEELEFARNTKDKAISVIEKFAKQNKVGIETFISLCKKRFPILFSE